MNFVWNSLNNGAINLVPCSSSLAMMAKLHLSFSPSSKAKLLHATQYQEHLCFHIGHVEGCEKLKDSGELILDILLILSRWTQSLPYHMMGINIILQFIGFNLYTDSNTHFRMQFPSFSFSALPSTRFQTGQLWIHLTREHYS